MRIKTLLLFLILTPLLKIFGQEKDTIKKITPIDSIPIATTMDSLPTLANIDSIPLLPTIDSIPTLTDIDSIPVLTKLDSLRIVTDSLLKPFYEIKFDSLQNKTVYTPKYRMVIHPISRDTIYEPIPKEAAFITALKRLVADTIKILNPIKPVKITKRKYAPNPVWWDQKNKLGFDINEATFLNWKSGGNNSISGRLIINLVRNYKKLHMLWNNELIARYGVNQQESQELRKTDDRFEINSTVGYRKDTISNWFYSLKFNFNTQFTNGYKYPNTDDPISRLFAPAYLFLGTGFHYELKENNFSLYLSPITLKSTFVLDKTISNAGSFGVSPGEKSKHEFGSLVDLSWRQKLDKNIEMVNRLTLYSDYLKDFGNIDIDWNLNFNLAVNKYIKANIGGFLIYDNDIKFKEDKNNDGIKEEVGSKIQLKQLLGIGFMYTF
ncbi:DUF3078 domain-containing protein [Flavobacteriaceae bacterium F08102]|nr:DUF3078 domain-containing protein [Flavobacteriaceae bacterium F08102]